MITAISSHTLALTIIIIINYIVSPCQSGQFPVPPIFPPCDFPSPLLDPHRHRSTCPPLPLELTTFLCDVHGSLAHVDLSGIENAYKRYRQFFINENNRSTLAVIIVRQLEAPVSSSQIYSSPGYSCLFHTDCSRVSADLVSALLLNVRTYLKVYALKVWERWFPVEECVSSPNVLALMVLDGFVNDVRKIPYVRIHTGSTKLNFAMENIQLEANNGLVQGWPMQNVVRDLVDDIGYALKELHELNGEVRDHSVPSWARRTFIFCGFLVVAALLVEWYIVRRKLGVQKSGGGLKISTGRSKTHLMF